jgi:hypothetical protein
VYYAYLDESYTDQRYYIAAAVGEKSHWDEVAEKLQAIRDRTATEHGVPNTAEFHAVDLMGGRKEWKPLRGKHREAAAIYMAVLRAANSSNIKFILRGVDIDRLNARYKYPSQPHEVVLGHTLERLHERCRDFHSGEKVSVMADEIATQAQHIRQFGAYQLFGTPGYRRSTLSTIEPPITFGPSHSEPGLQIADFGAYLHRRRETIVEKDPRGAAAMVRLCAELDAMVTHNLTWIP